jgi:hypothetical protein
MTNAILSIQHPDDKRFKMVHQRSFFKYGRDQSVM